MNGEFRRMLGLLFTAQQRTRASRTVEVFGWLILAEGSLILFAPHLAASLVHLPAMIEPTANYFRLLGLLIGGIGMLYVASGRLGAKGFVFASLLDRPLVPFVMAALWYFDLIAWQLALLFFIQDFGSFLWTLFTWKAELRSTPQAAGTAAS